MPENLFPYPSYTPVSDATQSFEASVEPGPLDAGFVTVHEGFAPKLTTHHRRWFEVGALTTPDGPESFTRDVPNVGEEALQALDERGVVQVGTLVTPGALLVGKVSPRGGTPLSPEEKLLRAIFGEKAGEVVDRSLRAPGGCFGEVSAVEFDEARARVEVSWTRPLEVGDLLALDGRLAVVAAIQCQGADLACQGTASRVRVKKEASARDVMHARFIGPSDLATQQPLLGREQHGGQQVGPGLAAVLGAHAPWLLWECFTLKSDAVNGRIRSYESIVKQENPARDLASAPAAPAAPATGAPGLFDFFEKPKDGLETPEAAVRLGAWLRALGLEVKLDAEAPGVALLTAEQVRSSSHGRVEAGSQFSQKIFGPERDYECECGQYKRMKHRGTVCEKCGVEVLASKVRGERFGFLELAAPCVSPLFPGVPLEVLPVLPAGLRPAPSPLNTAYTRVLEAASPSEVQRGVDALFSALTSMVEECWRTSVFSKAVDSSGVAHLTVDASLAPGTCRLPRPMLTELFKPFVYGLLEAQGLVTTIKSAKRMVESDRPEVRKAVELVSESYPLLLACGAKVVIRSAIPWDQPAIAVDPDTARRLGDVLVCVHLPITTQGVLEALRLPDLPSAGVSGARGWLSEAMNEGSLMEKVRRAAQSHELEPLEDPVLRCALGRPPPSPPEAELQAWEEARRGRELATPLAEPPAESTPPAGFERSLDELEMSVSSANVLRKAGFQTVGDLCQRTESELLKMDGFGRKSLKEVKELLAALGLSLGMRG